MFPAVAGDGHEYLIISVIAECAFNTSENMGVVNSTQSHNLCNTWNICINILFIIGISRKSSPSSYSSTTVLIWVNKSPEAQDTAVGLPSFRTPEVPQPSKPTVCLRLLKMHLTHLQTSCWHRRAQGKLMMWMGITAWTKRCDARSSCLYQFSPKTHGNTHSSCSYIWFAAQTYLS